MAVFVLSLVFLFAITGHSDASYCTCNDGLSTDVYQKNIDYACGAGADCSPIMQNGPCFQPNTVKDHCNYAVNSYYQKKGQNIQSCSFLNTATVTQSAPTASSGCVYPSSPSNTGTAPPTTPSTGGTPTIGGTPGTPTGGTPTGGTPTGGTPTGGTPTGGTPSTMVPGTTTGSPGFGLGPTGSGFSNTDSSASSVTLVQSTTLFMYFSMTLFISGLMCLGA
ncbi:PLASMODESMATA CALLOSE-BINDING PROTEIN 3-like [Forsythia ovata]|uniref:PLASMODESMATA CALLOSE-BINDING PROTEIN 3-like n=1 Tax=Forsythia ovata TaxID=205694 RepID=A0ABD1WAG3_9LAMI